ncbi:hypothetical protein ACTFIV_004652 [Dictyostelium citrinum]
MFDSHIEDLIENRVMNDDITSNKSSPSLKSIQPPISRGLKDLINHPPTPKSNLSDIGSVGSQNSSKSTTPQLNKKSKTTSAINSSIKFANRKDQSLREVVEEWRTDFYPDLSYDYFNENPITPSNNNNSNYSFNGNKNNEKEEEEEEEEEEDKDTEEEEEDENSTTEDGDNDENNEEKEDDTKNNSTYNEYINNLNNMKDQKIEQVEQESLLEQRVKQWKSDTRSDILESSELFMEHLPQRVFEKKVISELPMTPSTKREPIQSPPNNKKKNNNNNSSGGKSQFEYWRENFNKTMDEKMKEKKRTNKITITSNK